MRVVPRQVEDVDGFVEWAVGQPEAALRGPVRSYLGYREEKPAPVHRQETPAGQLAVIISFGDGFRTQAGSGVSELSPYSSFVAGIHEAPSRTAHDGRQYGVLVRLDPLGAFAVGRAHARAGQPGGGVVRLVG